MEQKGRAVLVHFRDSIDDYNKDTAHGTLPEMIPIDISIGFEPSSAQITHQLHSDELAADIFAAFYQPGTCSDRMAKILTDVQRKTENPICIYVERRNLIMSTQFQAITALLVACLATMNSTPTKKDRQLAETLKICATPRHKIPVQPMPHELTMIGSLRSLFTWLLHERHVEARFVGECLSTWFDCAANPVQDDVNSQARRLIRTKSARELALLAVQHPFAEVPVKSNT